MVLRAAYNDGRPSEWWPSAHIPVVAAFHRWRRRTGEDLFSLFDDTVARLLEG